jgi:hypothetical protein
MIQLSHGYTVFFTVEEAGVGVAADATPAATLYRNGSASGETVTVASTATTGLYKATFTTLSGWSVTDVLHLAATAIINGNSGYTAVVWDSTGDVDAAMRGTDGANTTTPPTVAAIADGVWDEPRTGHDTAGTFGFYVDAAISESGGAIDYDAVAAAIWDAATADHDTADTFGAAAGNVPSATENGAAAAAATRTELAPELAKLDENVSAAKTLTADYDAAKTAATQASIAAIPDATANGTAAAAAIERADGMLKKVPKIGDQVRRVNQLNKHVDETLSEVPE